MVQEIVVSHDEFETQVVILEDGLPAELFRSGEQEEETRGDIYLGRVRSVLPGIQVAFVDIGLERDAFLHVSDVMWNTEVAKRVPANNPVKLTEECRKVKRKPRGEHEPISSLVKEGQVMLVQIDKAAIRDKGPRVTTQIRIPGRYLVLMPTSTDIGISRRIQEEAERHRLKDLILRLREDEHGFIVRTVAEGVGEDELATDMALLHRKWREVQKDARKRRAPAQLHQEENLVLRVIRDRMNESTAQIIMDSPEIAEVVRDYLKENLPLLMDKAILYKGKTSLFESHGITQELKRALRQKVWLPCGAHIIIEQTEALVGIKIRDTAWQVDPVQVNLEGVAEIVRQIRLRDIGGIVVIDFLQMASHQDRRRVHQALHQALHRDRAATNILRFSELGLVQMTRQRTKRSLEGALCEECPYCEGQGWILSAQSITLDVLRSIRRLRRQARRPGLKIRTNEMVAARLLDQDSDKVEALEKSLKFRIQVQGDVDLHLEEYRILNISNDVEIYSSVSTQG